MKFLTILILTAASFTIMASEYSTNASNDGGGIDSHNAICLSILASNDGGGSSTDASNDGGGKSSGDGGGSSTDASNDGGGSSTDASNDGGGQEDYIAYLACINS